jgi:triphosphoribosyl-dephospho-CoA synthase
MENKYTLDERAFALAAMANRAILYEVACFPSPGLVSPTCNGAHKDMDFFTFIDSASAIYKFLVLFAESGFSSKGPKEIFMEIRALGIRCEEEMLKATKGVNTHKGTIFLMGICIAAVAKAIYENKEFETVRNIIMEMTAGIVEAELVQRKLINTHGEKSYNKYGIKGIRGEVESGIPIVFNFSLDFYKRNRELHHNDRAVKTLIGIMQYCEDSNIIYRQSLEVLEEVKLKAKKLLELDSIRFREALKELNEELVNRNISPGGSADLLSVTIFLAEVEEYMKSLTF